MNLDESILIYWIGLVAWLAADRKSQPSQPCKTSLRQCLELGRQAERRGQVREVIESYVKVLPIGQQIVKKGIGCWFEAKRAKAWTANLW